MGNVEYDGIRMTPVQRWAMVVKSFVELCPQSVFSSLYGRH